MVDSRIGEVDTDKSYYQYRSKEMGHSPPPGVLSWEWHRRRSTQRGVKPRTGDKEKVVFYACT
jgi:hypothetical protein